MVLSSCSPQTGMVPMSLMSLLLAFSGDAGGWGAGFWGAKEKPQRLGWGFSRKGLRDAVSGREGTPGFPEGITLRERA